MRGGIIALVALSSLLFGGCDYRLTPHPKGTPTNPEEKVANDGEGGNMDDRERADAFFQALRKVKTADEEKTVVIDFAKWLNANGY